MYRPTRHGGINIGSIVQLALGTREIGDFEDRRHVAGSESHRFSHVPESSERWPVQSRELVGLPPDDDPRVYVSAHLPRRRE
jgi:hypothetical protein